MPHNRPIPLVRRGCTDVSPRAGESTRKTENHLVTVERPSTKRVRNTQLALVNMPSLSETIINCDWEKCDLSICPMFCVCERSNAASISSRMYLFFEKKLALQPHGTERNQHWSGLEAEESKYEREREEGALAARQLGERLLPGFAKGHADLKTV